MLFDIFKMSPLALFKISLQITGLNMNWKYSPLKNNHDLQAGSHLSSQTSIVFVGGSSFSNMKICRFSFIVN